ncbi:unnamed protein product [Urochloa humidicola]
MLASASTGLMNSVLEKLAGLMVDDSTKLVGVHKQLQLRFLHHELSSMRGALEDVADMEDPNKQTKAWRNEVTELAYDTEDCIDDFRHRVEGPHDGHGLMRRAAHLLETLMARYQISRKIKELRTRVQEASDRRTRYKLEPDECFSRSAHVSVDPRITALYAETSSLVGIDAPKKEVIKLLTEVDDSSLQELRVVSIIGFGGLGKTTLANEVYRNLRGSFSCSAIISVSQRPDIMSLLKSLFSKISCKGADHTYDLQGLIDKIRECLQGQRYFLVVDDLWDASAWEILNCAFPESHRGSRVLTTTRIESVGVASCNYQWKFVYRMKPLDNYHSRQLFLRRIFGSGDKCPEPFEGLHEKILQKCGGLPLAIVTIASLLASQPTRSIDHWKFILNSMRHNLGLDPTLEAEGFVMGVDGREAVEVAGSYLNELVNRSMITQHLKYGAKEERITYRVHDMVLDLILSKSTEENFLCAVQNLQAISTRQNKPRRLSLQFHDRSLVETTARVSLPHVRSLIIFGWPLGSLGLLELKFIRALYIERPANELDLTLIGKFFQLRCLCVGVNVNCKRLQLPEEISGLRRLEAVVILSGLSSVPQGIASLPALLYSQFPPPASYPDGIGNMKCLHTLRSFDPSKQSVANTWALGELSNLRVLDLLIADARFATKEEHMDALMSSLEKLMGCNLKTLSIVARDNVGHHGRWNSLRFSCSHLEQLQLFFGSPMMPAWISQLRALSNLKLRVRELCKDDVAVLAGLPALARLVLDAGVVPAEGVVFSVDTAFRFLGYLRVPYVAEAGITFEAGSMPQVETLRFLLKASDLKRHGIKLAGIEHLTNLKQVLINLRNGNCDESEVPVVKEAIRSAFDAHPACSSLQIEFY